MNLRFIKKIASLRLIEIIKQQQNEHQHKNNFIDNKRTFFN